MRSVTRVLGARCVAWMGLCGTLLIGACGGAAGGGGDPDAVADAGGDAAADAVGESGDMGPAPDVEPPGGPDMALDAGPPGVALDDVVVTPTEGGGFELRRAGRLLLAADTPPIAALDYAESVHMTFGIFKFSRADVVARTAPTTTPPPPRRDGDAIVLEWGGLEASATLEIRAESASELSLRAQIQPAGASLRLAFRCDAEARFLGFGEQYNDLEHRGRAFPLWTSEEGIGRNPARPTPFSGDHTTTYFPLPFFLDPRGFGLSIETPNRVEVDLCAADPSTYTLDVAGEAATTLRLYSGPTLREVLRDFTARHGRSSTPPAWAVEGVWLGVQGGPDRVRAELADALAHDIPLGALWVQDWVGRRDFGAGNTGLRYRWSTDETLYPDLPGLIGEIHAAGVHFLGYFNPFLLPDQDLWETAVREGFAVLGPDMAPYTFLISVFMGGLVDLTNSRAVEWYQSFARAAVEQGQDGWMQDFGEWLPTDAVLHDGRIGAAVHNLYPTLWHAAARAVLDETRPDGDYVLLTRSGWLDEASTAQVVWAGDQEATWDPNDGLPTVIPALIGLGLSGVGFVTHDIAGFSGGPSDAELFQRWTELGAFTPIMRTHEGLRKAENWRWNRDDATRAHFGRFARIHRALAPLFLALGQEHQQTGMPIVRGLSLVFPDDPLAASILDEYLIGDDMLVAPVVTPGVVARSVYFPAGRWYDVWAPETSYDGPGAFDVPAPIGRPPVFSTEPRADLAAVE